MALAAMFVLGYVVVAAALNVITRLWYSFHWFQAPDPIGCFTPGLLAATPVLARSARSPRW